MSLQRIVSAETLDNLCEVDPSAMRSRRDLQLVHRVMGTRSIVCRTLNQLAKRPDYGPLRVLELGAGDGTLMLSVARALGPAWANVELTLLDRQALVASQTIEAYRTFGWRVDLKVMDVIEWIDNCIRGHGEGKPRSWDLIVANLFIHHFQGTVLSDLLNAAAGSCDQFFACEPRRSYLALVGSHLIGALGVNAVTRHDAVLSVHAGFCDTEISRLWPASMHPWQIAEYPAGLFSHCFSANRL
ncbi:class I SAM-dependent methyltransferase [Caballeronia sp. LjRoot29]|uniref:class I SAM-dependent methyltransferase n=1 Tax=Caballeronia sp. LjRoot29 TaxID=3342315 RepID=UPI003ECC8B63